MPALPPNHPRIRADRRRPGAGAMLAGLVLLFLMVLAGFPVMAQAQGQGPAERTYDIPAGPLSSALARFAAASDTLLSANEALTQGRTTTGLKGRYTIEGGLRRLLEGTGLEAVGNSRDGYSLQRGGHSGARDSVMIGQRGDSNALPDLVAPTVTVSSTRTHEIGPIPGLALTREQIPGNVQSISAEQIKQAHSVSLADLMNSQLQSVNVNDYQSNPFQMDVTYRGFTAGPQLGTPQGLSVFFDGIRVNEPFGDVVNWDMIPMNALAGIDVFPGSNPIFGLGTLGGAFAMRTKSGFDSPGIETEVLAGSFGRKQLQATGGWNNGTVGLFGAGSFFMEDGWRDNSPSKVNQAFGKASYRSGPLDLHLSSLVAWNDLVGNGLIPSQMYEQSRTSVFSSPDETRNRLVQFQLSGGYAVTNNFSVTAQAYRRDSKRRALNGDVYTELRDSYVRRKLDPGEEYTCLFNSTNKYGLPDYYVIDFNQNDWFDPAYTDFYNFLMDYATNGVPNPAVLPASAFNRDLPEEFLEAYRMEFNIWKNYHQALLYGPQAVDKPGTPVADTAPWSNGEPVFSTSMWIGAAFAKTPPGGVEPFSAMTSHYYYTPDGVKHGVMILAPSNGANCEATQMRDVTSQLGELSQLDPATGGVMVTDGFGTNQPGFIEGTPTAILTNTEIDQIVHGASLQLNWNYDRHKFMVGASIDAADARYGSGAMLGLLDERRHAFLAPHLIREQYAAAYEEVRNNDFDGTSVTKSLYASETWSPVERWHFTGAVRYNDTKVRNTLASRSHGFTVLDISQYEAFPDMFNVCVDGVCPTTGYKVPDLARVLNPPETEKFSYYSLNPSLGATWQAQDDLNLYGNWARGARTPSVIELGCALDHSLVKTSQGYIEKSIIENRSCSLPSTLSGDPYLPQIRAQTVDIGARGRLTDQLEWNLGLFRTDLKDDIYLVTYPGNKSYFDTIGRTRRQGIEAGLGAQLGKARLRFNYALTDATFQSSFVMVADDNSSASLIPYCHPSGQCTYDDPDDPVKRIRVKPGDRIPGIPLHNFNATLSYDMTEKWQVGLTAIGHSSSYVRGNENNEHQPGVSRIDRVRVYDGSGGSTIQYVKRQPGNNPGTVPGYVVFNFQTSYRFAPGWTLGLLVSNIFDTEYFTAGRLGRNPFSPSIYGAIGPSGYNHNSGEWLSTNFLAPGAPRAAWLSVSYAFGVE